MPADLAGLCTGLGLDLSPAQLGQLEAYAERLATSAHNLTSARDRDQVETRHVAESLALGRLLDAHGLLADGSRVIDIGAGGGLPGIPLRIAWPGIVLTLLESVGKKCRFLEGLARDLALDSVTILEGRAETYGHDAAHREQYDLVVARAVAPLPVLIEYALPFLRPGGRLAAVKGSTALTEIDASVAALSELNARLYDVPVFQPPHGQPQTAVLIEKLSPTPARYPRRPGIPSKRPL
ncbi:MAG TPA: 16S rRNA (guanine(527)-N(7))-methyltransferase RsmG [Dehalococcoidia bacterium]|nr:16S rRNA (guanine(527)-N(7))-methyltransferase RsmG [Dehalococcoidia bacterium]